MVLPKIMVAPNGARKTKLDHPAMPVSIDEVVAAAVESRAVGATGLHAHVRDDNGQHVLDAGLYHELLVECELMLPDFYVQITTEAVGRYSAYEQDALVREIVPASVSVCLKEMTGEGRLPVGSEKELAREFYHWAKEAEIDVQHILFDVSEFEQLISCIDDGIIPNGDLQLLFVLGRYTQNMESSVSDLLPFVTELKSDFFRETETDWAVCAFGRAETDCLLKAVELGGKTRIGFENNMLNRDGSLATSNAERVKELVQLIDV
jgi:3-keto-5-aminohexanoate cleavage enzyme